MAKYTLPRGMKDVEAGEMRLRQYVYGKIVQVLRNFNFQLVEPSTLENMDTLVAKSGEAIKDEIYWFKDKGGRDIGLRFDLTVGMTRMVASSKDTPLPIKIAAIGDMFRYDEPQYGRYRNFYQWDVEIYGSPDQTADAESIAVGVSILESLGLKSYVVKINNRKLVEGFLESLGIDESKISSVLRSIDKLGKIGEERLESELRKVLSDKQSSAVLDFVKTRGNMKAALKKIKSTMPDNKKAKDGYDELASLAGFLEDYGIDKNCVIDMSIVRGIAYYTGIVFECYDEGKESLGAIFGGGRFDGLPKIYGRDMPATGVAGGIERTLLSLEGKIDTKSIESGTRVFVANVNEDMTNDAVKIVSMLREAGIPADYSLKQKPLKKQMEYADSMGVSFVVILGEAEMKKGEVKVKDMMGEKEYDVKTKDLVKFFTSD